MFCVPYHTLSVYPTLQKQKNFIAFEMAFSVFCVPYHTLSETPTLQKLYSIWNGIFDVLCTLPHAICVPYPTKTKNFIAFEMAYSVGRVQGYTLTMYPPNKNKNTS